MLTPLDKKTKRVTEEKLLPFPWEKQRLEATAFRTIDQMKAVFNKNLN